MKKQHIALATALLAILPTVSARADIETPDTLFSISTSVDVTIIEKPSGNEITVTGEQGDTIKTIITEYSPEAMVKSSSHTTKNYWQGNRNLLSINCGKTASPWGVWVGGVCLGLTNAVGQTQSGGLQWSKSIEICWMSCINVYYKFMNSKISLGLGFDWRNYKITTSDKCLVANTDKGLDWGEYPDGATGCNSRLKVFSLQLPLLYEWEIPKTSLSFKAGPIFCFNTHSSLKTVWNDAEGNRRELFTKDISPRRFTLDFFGSLSLCNDIGLYVRYSPMKVMDATPSLNFRPLTVGVTIAI